MKLVPRGYNRAVKEQSKAVSVRMPRDIRAGLDQLATVAHLSRSQLLVIAVRVLLRHAKRRGGSITLPYSAHFAADELAFIRGLVEAKNKS